MKSVRSRFAEIMDQTDKEASEFQRDLETTTQLIRENYPIHEISDVLRKEYLGREDRAGDARAGAVYVDKIMDGVNRELVRETHSDFKDANEAMQKKIAADRSKYREYQEEDGHPRSYRQGAIVIGLIVDGRYDPKTLERVIEQTGCFGQQEPEETHRLIEGCKAVRDHYDAILGTDVNEPTRTAKDFYMKYAKEYLLQTKSTHLSLRDDEQIMATMYKELLPLYKEKMPDTPAGKELLERNIQESLKPFLRQALEMGSPVAMEPHRDREKYIKAVLYGAEHMQDTLETSKDHYLRTKTEYLAMLETFQKKQAQEKAYHSFFVQDAVMAKELLDNHCSPNAVQRVIEEESPIAHDDEKNPQESPKAYAEWILHSAQDTLHREKEILYAEDKKIPEGISYDELTEKHGITAKDLYVQGMKERLRLYPNFRNHMADAATDRDIICHIATQYPQAVRSDIYNAIEENSPMQAMPAVGESYARDITETAYSDLAKAKEKTDKQKALRNEFNRIHGFASEGIFEDSPMSAYKDGRVALRMLQKHVSREDICHLIKEMAPQTDKNISREMYATGILNHATCSLDRMKQLAAFQTIIPFGQLAKLRQAEARQKPAVEESKTLPQEAPKENGEKKDNSPAEIQLEKEIALLREAKDRLRQQEQENSLIRQHAEDYYQLEAKKALATKQFADTSMDIRIAQAMLLAKVDEETVRRLIAEKSPVAVEAGRDEKSYTEYIDRMAKYRIEEEEKKLENYISLPREEHWDEAEQEYNYQLKKLTDFVHLPFRPKMDEKIAHCMMQEKFPEKVIENTIAQETLAQTSEPYEYATNIVQRAKNAQKAMKKKKVEEKTEEKTSEHTEQRGKDTFLVKNLVRVRTRKEEETEEDDDQ